MQKYKKNKRMADLGKYTFEVLWEYDSRNKRIWGVVYATAKVLTGLCSSKSKRKVDVRKKSS